MKTQQRKYYPLVGMGIDDAYQCAMIPTISSVPPKPSSMDIWKNSRVVFISLSQNRYSNRKHSLLARIVAMRYRSIPRSTAAISRKHYVAVKNANKTTNNI